MLVALKPTSNGVLRNQSEHVVRLDALCTDTAPISILNTSEALKPTKMSRRNRKRSEQFMGIPYSVLDSQNFIRLSPNGIRLLIDLYRQYNGRNNGDLSAALTLMRKRGWKSQTTLSKCVKELLDADLIQKTREGYFQGSVSSQCALYAVTWRGVDECPGKNLEVKPNPRPAVVFSILNKTSPSPSTGDNPIQKLNGKRIRDARGRYLPNQ